MKGLKGKGLKALKATLALSILLCIGLTVYYVKTTSQKEKEQKKIEQEEKALMEYITNTPQSDRITYAADFFYESVPYKIQQKMVVDFDDEDVKVSLDDLKYVQILYYDFDKKEHVGQIICNEYIAQDLVEIFYELHKIKYPFAKISLIDEYNGDDIASMADNNTSCFNYRTVSGSSVLSLHAQGYAIDINPLYNPYVIYNSDPLYVLPAAGEPYTDREAEFEGKITTEDPCYKLFIEHGFSWGGNWSKPTDYQHFEKVPVETEE